MKTDLCQHRCTVTYTDGQEEQRIFNWSSLKSLITELAPENVTNPLSKDHFSGY